MKKIIVSALILTLSIAAFAGCGKAASDDSNSDKVSETGSASQAGGELNLFTWEGMFPQEVLDGFTSETGIKVNYSSFDTDETMLAKLETAKGGSYDLVIADDYIVETVIGEKLAQKLDKSKLANEGNIDSFYQGQFFDSQNEYTVPYGAGVQTIVYNPELVGIDIKNYADLWDDSLKSSVGITSNFRVMNGMALKMAGESYNTEDIAAIDAAGAKMLSLAPNIRLIKDDNLQDDLISGEISAGVMYTSQATIALQSNPQLKLVYPGEGVGFGIMAQFIPVNAPNSDAAHAFIDYILQPEISKECFQYIGYYCTNAAAYDLLDDGFKENIILPDEFRDDTEMIRNISAAAVEEHTKVWTEFKTACGL